MENDTEETKSFKEWTAGTLIGPLGTLQPDSTPSANTVAHRKFARLIVSGYTVFTAHRNTISTTGENPGI